MDCRASTCLGKWQPACTLKTLVLYLKSDTSAFLCNSKQPDHWVIWRCCESNIVAAAAPEDTEPLEHRMNIDDRSAIPTLLLDQQTSYVVA